MSKELLRRHPQNYSCKGSAQHISRCAWWVTDVIQATKLANFGLIHRHWRQSTRRRKPMPTTLLCVVLPVLCGEAYMTYINSEILGKYPWLHDHSYVMLWTILSESFSLHWIKGQGFTVHTVTTTASGLHVRDRKVWRALTTNKLGVLVIHI